MKSLNQWLTLGVVVSVLALPTFAQTTPTQPSTQTPSAAAGAAQANPCEEQAAVDLYIRWRDNVKTDQKVAFEAGNQYLEKYSSCGEYAKAVKTFVDKYSKAVGKIQIEDLMKQQKFAEAYALGKQNLASEPEDLQTLINTSYAGLRVATAPGAPDTASTEASNYATKTIQLIEAGKSPGKEPMTAKDKDDTLGWLNYALGIYAIKNNPAEAIKYLHKAATYEGWAKKDSQTYSLLALAYQSGMYLPMSTEYKKKYEGKDETPESKAAIAQLDQVMDRMIDAYARAVSLAAAPQKAELTQTLTEMLKIRNNGQTVDSLIQGAAAKPLPSPTLPAVPTTTPTTDSAGTPASTTTPAGTTTAAPTSTAAPASTGTTTTAPATTTSPTTTTAPATTTSPTTTSSPATTTTPQSGTKPAETKTTQPSTTQPSTAQPRTTQPGSTTTTSPSGQKPNTTPNSTRP